MARRLSPNAAVAWLPPPPGRQGVAGQAFVSEQVALTCAHVVRDQLGLGDVTPATLLAATVKLSFGALRREVTARVAECGWSPDGTGADVEDVAVLLLDEPLDEIPYPGLAPVHPPDRAECYAYGSLAGYTGIGQQAWTLIAQNLNDRGWHQLNADTTRARYFAKRDFSGAPVLDPLAVTVWGMLVQVDKGAEDEKRLVAFALAAEALREAYSAVKRCARKAGRSAPEVTIRPEGPLDSLARDAAVALLPTGTVEASGLDRPVDAAVQVLDEDRLDAVRALAVAGSDPAQRYQAAAGLRGLKAGDTTAAERFFAARVAQTVHAAPSGPAAGPTGWLGSLASAAARWLGATLAGTPRAPLPDPTVVNVAAAEAAAEARHLGAILALRDVRRAMEAYETAARLQPDDTWIWIGLARLAGQAGLLERAANATMRVRDGARASGNERNVSAASTELGDLYVAQGDLASASKAYEAGRVIAERLAASDPGNTGWQRNLSVSWNKQGDVRKAQGDLAGALAAYEAGRAIRERLAASDPGNAVWQRDLSVSWEKLGDVRQAQDDLAGALAAYEASQAIAERLAAADPGKAEWQRDLIVSNVKLAEISAGSGDGPGAAAHYRQALVVARALAGSGRLAPVDAWMVTELERRLAAAEGAAGGP
jgi:tetratricopeptide (TPR) repeat protein